MWMLRLPGVPAGMLAPPPVGHVVPVVAGDLPAERRAVPVGLHRPGIAVVVAHVVHADVGDVAGDRLRRGRPQQPDALSAVVEVPGELAGHRNAIAGHVVSLVERVVVADEDDVAAGGDRRRAVRRVPRVQQRLADEDLVGGADELDAVGDGPLVGVVGPARQRDGRLAGVEGERTQRRPVARQEVLVHPHAAGAAGVVHLVLGLGVQLQQPPAEVVVVDVDEYGVGVRLRQRGRPRGRRALLHRPRGRRRGVRVVPARPTPRRPCRTSRT